MLQVLAGEVVLQWPVLNADMPTMRASFKLSQNMVVLKDNASMP